MNLEEREKNRLRMREYRKTHPNYNKAYNKKYRATHKEQIKKTNQRRLRFKDKHIFLESIPRIGICSRCGKSVAKGEIKRTNTHHLKYDFEHPDNHTIELCVKCHIQEHEKTRVRILSMTIGAIQVRNWRAKQRERVAE